jgi:hypothetical protein
MSAFGQGRFRYSSAEVWPAAAEGHVRKVMDDVGWWTLQPSETADLSVLRATSEIGAAWPFQSESHVLVVFAGVRPGALVGLRPPSPMDGAFVDPMTGDSIEAVAFDGEAGSYWQLLVPASRALVLLALKRTEG